MSISKTFRPNRPYMTFSRQGVEIEVTNLQNLELAKLMTEQAQHSMETEKK